MVHSSQLYSSLSRAPQLPVALEQFRCCFTIWQRQTLVSHFKVDGANRAVGHRLRSLVANPLRNRFRLFVPFQRGLVVAGFAIDKAERNECLTLNREILCLLSQRQRFGKRAKR